MAAVLLGGHHRVDHRADPDPGRRDSLGAALLILLGVGGEDGADEVLAPFGSGTIFTFIGAFILAQSMLKHGLARTVRVPHPRAARASATAPPG